MSLPGDMILSGKKKSVTAHFNDGSHYFSKRFDIRLRADIARELLGDVRGKTMIDIGCGDGSISLQFQSKTNSITLVDISDAMLHRAVANIRPGNSKTVSLVRSDIDTLDPENEYDIALAFGLLAHVDSVERAVKALSGLLKPGGICLVQITDAAQMVSKILSLYNLVIDKLTGSFGYARNPICAHSLKTMAGHCGLDCIDSVQYAIVLPGFISLLPDPLLYRYHKFVKNSRRLSSMGTDVVLCFRKTG